MGTPACSFEPTIFACGWCELLIQNLDFECRRKEENALQVAGTEKVAHLLEAICHLGNQGPVVYFQQLDVLRVRQIGQQLGSEKEALWGARLTRCFHQLSEDLALVHRVHPLIDLVHDPEGALGHILRAKHIIWV
jgi:hypothetical protein